MDGVPALPGKQKEGLRTYLNPLILLWRRHPDLNWRIAALQAVALPLGYAAKKNGAGNEIRTRDFDLGKVALYH